jgi:hypothetical protein
VKVVATSTNIDIPMEFLCPITKEVMSNPLMTRSGLNFERSAIIDWLHTGDGNCPINGTPLEASDLITNHALEEKIARWRWENMLPEPPTLTENRFSSVSLCSLDSVDSVVSIAAPKKKKVEAKFLKHFLLSKVGSKEVPLSTWS